jgi:arginine decarboxylase
MHIICTSGTGEGPTPLAAFDAALLQAGVANYNLICLSSVIPPASVIQCRKFCTPADEYGDRLYVVMASREEHECGKAAWAGLGWTQGDDGRGLFVEMNGGQKPEVETSIQATLKSMITTRQYSYGPIQSNIAGIECREKPVCAIVVAVYKNEGWD